MPDELKTVTCAGEKNGKSCTSILFQTDDEFLYVEGYVLNRNSNVQTIICGNCDTPVGWKRDERFINRNQ